MMAPKPILRRLQRLFLRPFKNDDGVAATEFAILLPVMVALFFGMLESGDAMTVNRRVSLSINAAADLAAQSDILTVTDVDALIDGAMTILEPQDTSAVTINLVCVILDDEDNPVVHWSRDQKQDEPYAQGDDYLKLGTGFETNSDGLVRLRNRSLIIAEIKYPYEPRFFSYFMSDPIDFNRSAMRAPRLVPVVELCDAAGQNCTDA